MSAFVCVFVCLLACLLACARARVCVCSLSKVGVECSLKSERQDEAGQTRYIYHKCITYAKIFCVCSDYKSITF